MDNKPTSPTPTPKPKAEAPVSGTSTDALTRRNALAEQNRIKRLISEEIAVRRSLTAEQVQVEIQNRDSWVRVTVSLVSAVAGLALSGVLIWKAAITPELLAKLDFSDVLALILALFSIWLSVSFYYKATEQSNAFYDRVFAFNKEVGVTLGRMDERFGEKLTHLGENQARMDSLLRERQVARQDVASREQELSAQVEEQNLIIAEFTANPTQEEAFRKQLQDSAAQVAMLQVQLDEARIRANIAETRLHTAPSESRESEFDVIRTRIQKVAHNNKGTLAWSQRAEQISFLVASDEAGERLPVSIGGIPVNWTTDDNDFHHGTIG